MGGGMTVDGIGYADIAAMLNPPIGNAGGKGSKVLQVGYIH